ncbi:MAG: prolipoprotein diacylglyceryl transferase [Chloroflexota bacterium]|nr:prolipoprotein diacylglyceryl transferase [Chloroflexota bacterium]
MPSPASPVAFTILGIEVRWYAIFILLGIVAAVILVRWLAKRRGMDADFPIDAAPWVVLAGIVGARGYYILLRFDYFLANPGEAINLRLGGLTIHGAIAGGLLMLAFLCRRQRQPFLRWCDLIVPGLALAQAIGRWGNWANQEAFGGPTNLPWGVAIDAGNRPPPYAASERFHPTFLYESAFNLLYAVILSWLVFNAPRLRWYRDGDALWIYLILYGSIRFVIEAMRTDSLYIGPFPAAHWISGGMIVVGAAMLLVRHRWTSTEVAGHAR